MKMDSPLLPCPAFITALKIIKVEVNGDDRWSLIQPLIYSSKLVDGFIVAPRGFLTDFASVPRVPVLYLLFGNIAHEAAVVHDYLYSTKPYDRMTCDNIFKEACSLIGIAWWRRIAMWAAVRVAGAEYWDSPKEPVEPLPIN